MAGEGDEGVKRGVVPERPPSYMWPSILATLCCFVPTGIVAIVKSASVQASYAGGDYERAKELSASAKTWLWVTFLCGFPFWFLFIFFILGIGGELFS